MESSHEKSNKAISSEMYLSRHCIATYFQDAVEQLLESKPKNTKLDPNAFLYEYFKSVHDGTNVFYREYSYIFATPRNRSAFIRNFWLTFKHLGNQAEHLLGEHDYYSLLCILCPDFDRGILQNTVNTVLMDDATDCVISMSDFIYVFQLQLYYAEFCDVCLQNFNKLHGSLSTSGGSTGTTMNASGEYTRREVRKSCSKSDQVSSALWYNYLKDELYIKIPEYSVPSERVLCSVFNAYSKLNFYGFMSVLSKDEDVIRTIGALPVLSSTSGVVGRVT